MFYQRKYSVHDLLFAIDRVNQCLSIVNTQRLFHRLCVSRINLQRKLGHRLQFLYDLAHHRHFIDLRQSHVDVKHRSAIFLLGDRLAQDIFQVVIAQRLFEL